MNPSKKGPQEMENKTNQSGLLAWSITYTETVQYIIQFINKIKNENAWHPRQGKIPIQVQID